MKARVHELSHYHLMLFVALVLLAYFFGIRGVFKDVIWRDELTTLGHIGALERQSNGISLTDTVNSLATYSAQHPPLYYAGANIWGRIISFDVYIIRVLSLLWGILALAVFYRLSADIGGYRVAFYATFLLATSVLFVYYLHEIREYTNVMFWAGLLWLYYRRMSKRTQALKLSQVIILTFITTCAIYTHYTVIFLLITMGFYHLFMVSKTKVWWQVSVAIVVAGVLYLPWLPTLLSGLQVTVDKLDAGDPKLMPNSVLMPVIIQFFGNGQAILFVVLIALGVISAWYGQRGSRYTVFFLVLVSLVVLFTNGNFEFIKRIRYVLLLMIPFCLLGGFGLVYASRWRIIPVAIIVGWLVVGTLFQSTKEYIYQIGEDAIGQFVEYNLLVPILKEVLLPDDVVVTVIDDYAAVRPSKQGFMSIEALYLDPLDVPYVNIDSHYAIEFDLDKVIAGIANHHSVWLTYHNSSDEPELIEFLSVFEKEYSRCRAIQYGDNSSLELYVASDEIDPRCTSVED